MGTGTDAALSALQQALKLEEAGYDFYVEAADRTTDPEGASMFRRLADDEVLHQRIIQRQVDALGAGEGWALSEETSDVEADLTTPLFPAGKVELEKAVRSDASDLDALLFALKIENDSFNLYVEQAKAAQDPNAKALYEFLVDAERSHFNLLMVNYDSLSSNSGWVG